MVEGDKDLDKFEPDVREHLKGVNLSKSSKMLTQHTVQSGETLSHLALKYYNHATEKYWRLIYEANKDQIGDNPNKIRTGMTLEIPQLPDDMR